MAEKSSDNIVFKTNAEFDIEKERERLKKATNLKLPLEQELELLEEMNSFPLGKWMLEQKGFNGYRTAYMTLHAPKLKSLPHLENWFIHRAPLVISRRECFFSILER